MKKISNWTIYTGIAFFIFFGTLLCFGSRSIMFVIDTGGYYGYILATSIWGFVFVFLLITDILTDKDRFV